MNCSIAEYIVNKYPDNIESLIKECEKCCMYDMDGNAEDNSESLWYFVDYSGIMVKLNEDHILVTTF